jgi:aldose 1-epimerase
MLLDRRGLPTGRYEEFDGEAERIGDRVFDDLYALGGDRRLGIAGGGRQVTIDLDEGYPFAQVYAPAGRRFVCLEPMTAATNSLVRGDAALVSPGDAFTARFTVSPSSTR